MESSSSPSSVASVSAVGRLSSCASWLGSLRAPCSPEGTGKVPPVLSECGRECRLGPSWLGSRVVFDRSGDRSSDLVVAELEPEVVDMIEDRNFSLMRKCWIREKSAWTRA